MLRLCEPLETGMDAVKLVDVSLLADGKEMLVCKLPSRKISSRRRIEAI